jgi:paired amphipathic helix protein Sin3a
MLFKNAPDLLGEFKGFLPDAGGLSVPVGGAIGIPPLPVGASGSVGPTWSQQDIPSTGPDRSKKSTTASKRKRRVVEKETTPVPAPRTTSSRVRTPPVV